MPPAGLCFACVTFLKCRPSHSTTGGRIATRIVALTPSMIEKIATANNLKNVGPVTPEIWLICMGGDCGEANIRSVLVKGQPIGKVAVA